METHWSLSASNAFPLSSLLRLRSICSTSSTQSEINRCRKSGKVQQIVVGFLFIQEQIEKFIHRSLRLFGNSNCLIRRRFVNFIGNWSRWHNGRKDVCSRRRTYLRKWLALRGEHLVRIFQWTEIILSFHRFPRKAFLLLKALFIWFKLNVSVSFFLLFYLSFPVREENERLMQESLNRAKILENITDTPTIMTTSTALPSQHPAAQTFQGNYVP